MLREAVNELGHELTQWLGAFLTIEHWLNLGNRPVTDTDRAFLLWFDIAAREIERYKDICDVATEFHTTPSLVWCWHMSTDLTQHEARSCVLRGAERFDQLAGACCYRPEHCCCCLDSCALLAEQLAEKHRQAERVVPLGSYSTSTKNRGRPSPPPFRGTWGDYPHLETALKGMVQELDRDLVDLAHDVHFLHLKGRRFFLRSYVKLEDLFSAQIDQASAAKICSSGGVVVLLLPDCPVVRHYAQLHRDLQSFVDDNPVLFRQRKLLDIHVISNEAHLSHFGHAANVGAMAGCGDLQGPSLTLQVFPK